MKFFKIIIILLLNINYSFSSDFTKNSAEEFTASKVGYVTLDLETLHLEWDLPHKDQTNTLIEKYVESRTKNNDPLKGYSNPFPLEELSKLPNLCFLSLGSLTGFLPFNIEILESLTYLHLSKNNLTGAIPDSICDLRNLKGLNLSYNNFIGPIPEAIRKLEHLEDLNLFHNQLTGFIPDTLWGCTALKSLNLGKNNFGDYLSPFIKNLKNLNYLYLFKNKFTIFPKEIFELPHLIQIDIRCNPVQALPKVKNTSGIKILYVSLNAEYFQNEHDLYRLLGLQGIEKIDFTVLNPDKSPLFKELIPNQSIIIKGENIYTEIELVDCRHNKKDDHYDIVKILQRLTINPPPKRHKSSRNTAENFDASH